MNGELERDGRPARELAKPVTYAVLRSAAALCIAGVRKLPELSIDPRAFKALCREASDIEDWEHVEVMTCIGRVRVRPAL